MKIRLLADAESEIDEAVAHYNEHAAGLGRDFAIEVRNGLRRIVERPEAWQRLGSRMRRCFLNRFPYGIVYAVIDDEIIVVAVMHLRRKPGYWRKRLTGNTGP